jgi:hypothetical protein
VLVGRTELEEEELLTGVDATEEGTRDEALLEL